MLQGPKFMVMLTTAARVVDFLPNLVRFTPIPSFSSLFSLPFQYVSFPLPFLQPLPFPSVLLPYLTPPPNPAREDLGECCKLPVGSGLGPWPPTYLHVFYVGENCRWS